MHHYVSIETIIGQREEMLGWVYGKIHDVSATISNKVCRISGTDGTTTTAVNNNI
jgi:hypothetical protein